MKVEFLQDTNQNIWLHYIKDIHYRRSTFGAAKNRDPKAAQEQVEQANREQEELLQREIREYERSLEDSNYKAPPKSEILVFMDNEYEQMKEEVGVDPNYAIPKDDPTLDIVLRKLRPNSNAANFREFMTQQMNVQKATPWKALGRETQKREDKRDEMAYRQQKSSVFSSGNFTRGQTLTSQTSQELPKVHKKPVKPHTSRPNTTNHRPGMRQSYHVRQHEKLDGVIRAIQSNANLSVNSFESSQDLASKSTRLQINQFASAHFEKHESNPQYYAGKTAHK